MHPSSQDRVGELCEELAPDLLAYLARRVEQPADAADLLSETFVVMCRRAKHIPDGQEARLWAFGVARKVLAGHRRSRHRRTALVQKLRGELSDTPQHTGAGEIANDRVHEALEGLDQIDREIVCLVLWEGFTQAETAVLLGLPSGTVRSRYSRARTGLRQQLQSTETQLAQD